MIEVIVYVWVKSNVLFVLDWSSEVILLLLAEIAETFELRLGKAFNWDCKYFEFCAGLEGANDPDFDKLRFVVRETAEAGHVLTTLPL